MSVRHGREFLAIPGPTTIPDEVLRAMNRPAVDIYSGGLVHLTDSCLADLKPIFSTAGRVYVYAANGHGAWEAALCNVLSRGDKILVAQSGLFAVGWGEMAKVMGVEVEILPGDWRRAVDPAALEARLKADTGAEIKAVLTVQIDTASSVVNDIAGLRKAIDAAGHDALFLVDTIASLATMPFEMDAWGVDVTVAGSQKGLMTPPGLGLAMSVWMKVSGIGGGGTAGDEVDHLGGAAAEGVSCLPARRRMGRSRAAGHECRHQRTLRRSIGPPNPPAGP